MLTYILAGFAMLGVLVFVHEFGHFVVAKAFGVGVPVFSFGMGPKVVGFEFRGTEYRLSAFPVGGYVRMAGADPFGEEDPDAYVDPDHDFMRKPVWQRLLVMLAGPVFNMALALFVLLGVLMSGEPQEDNSVGTVVVGSIAEKHGIQAGDHIVAVDGDKVDTWRELYEQFAAKDGAVQLSVLRDGATHEIELPRSGAELPDQLGMKSPRRSAIIGVDDQSSPAWKAGIRTGDVVKTIDGAPVSDWTRIENMLSDGGTHRLLVARADASSVLVDMPVITLGPDPAWTPRPEEPFPKSLGLVPQTLFVSPVVPVEPNSWQKFKYRLLGAPDPVRAPAQEAGITAGDRLLQIDGQPVKSFDDVQKYVAKSVDSNTADATVRPVRIALVHEGKVATIEVLPRLDRVLTIDGKEAWVARIGILAGAEGLLGAPKIQKRYALPEALPRAVRQSGEMMYRVIGGIYSLLSRQTSPQESLGGAIAIFRLAGQSFEAGYWAYLRLMAGISMNLGVVNLLPVPLLDGGQIVFYAVEWVRGRPLPVAVRERIQMVGVIALAALMLAVVVFDLDKWASGIG